MTRDQEQDASNDKCPDCKCPKIKTIVCLDCGAECEVSMCSTQEYCLPCRAFKLNTND